jgi:DNA-binding NtrC family response regulator
MKDHFDALIDHLLEGGLFLEEAVEILERGMIERVLTRTEGHQSQAAKILGIHRNTLMRKMAEHQLGGKRLRKPVASEVRRATAAKRAAS